MKSFVTVTEYIFKVTLPSLHISITAPDKLFVIKALFNTQTTVTI